MALSPQALQQRYDDSNKNMEAFLANPTPGGIDSDNLIEHLQAAYELGGGNDPIGLTGVKSFMDSFTPDDLTKNPTSRFCQQLFGFQTTKFRPLLTRTDDNQKQCSKAGYPNLVNVRCIWCGEPILDFSECEHALPILMAAPLLGFSTARADRRESTLEYGYAHRLCNQVKNDLSFLIWNEGNNNWEIDWVNMREMYIRISNVGKYRDKTVPNYEPHHAAPKALFYELDGSGSPGLGKARTVADYNSLNRFELPEIPPDQCNRLSKEGKHRNLEIIKTACNTIGQSIDLLTPQFNLGPVVVKSGGSKKKKKYNKILTQKGGVLVIPSRTRLGSDLLKINDYNLAVYLSQEIPHPFWNDNHLLYGVARMECIRDHVNSVLGRFGDDLESLRLYLLLKIIKSPNVNTLVEEATGAPPAEEPHLKFVRDKKLLLKKIKKEISAYNTIKIPLFTRMPRSPPRNLQQIIDDKKAAYVEIKATEGLIYVHNQGIKSTIVAGYRFLPPGYNEDHLQKDLIIALDKDIPYYQDDLRSRLTTIQAVWKTIKTGGSNRVKPSRLTKYRYKKLFKERAEEHRKKKVIDRRELDVETRRSDDVQMVKVLKKQGQTWLSKLSESANDVIIPSEGEIQGLIKIRLSEYGITVGGGGTTFFGGSMEGDSIGAGSKLGDSMRVDSEGGSMEADRAVPRQSSGPYGFPEGSGGLDVNGFCEDVLRPFIPKEFPAAWNEYATNIVTTLMTDLFKKVLLKDANIIIKDLYEFFKSDGEALRRTFGVELLYQIKNFVTKKKLRLPWIKTFFGNQKYLEVKINWLFNTLSEYVYLPSEYISKIKIIKRKERLVHINFSPPIEIPIPNNFKMLNNQIITKKSKIKNKKLYLKKTLGPSRILTRKYKPKGAKKSSRKLNDSFMVSSSLNIW